MKHWGVETAEEELIGSVDQPLCGGCLTPNFKLTEGDFEADGQAFWEIKGPHCQSELCCDATFNFFDMNETGQESPIGNVKKLKPGDAKGAAKALLTDADNFKFTLPKDADVVQKAIGLTSLIMLDYYFFEFGGATSCDPFAAPGEPCCSLTLCSQYCCGVMLPWKCQIQKPE